jgi:hypothetical protein
MAEAVFEELPEYTEPVQIEIDGFRIGWHPMLDTLSPDTNPDAEEFADSIEEYVSALAVNGYIRVSPEGPVLDGTVQSLPTVIWAAHSLYNDLPIRVVGTAPTLEDLGLDVASNYDEDGNEIVR